MYNFAELKEIVEKAIANLSINAEAGKLIDPVRYILSIGGKRLRPVMALMACNLFNDKVDDAIMPALGLEVFHNYTLVHDDIMDQASLRRNLPTIHAKWNLNQAILSGDVMAFIATDCFLQAPSHLLFKILRVFNKAAVEVCEGQQFDMDFEKAAYVSHNEYLRMIELKTAALLAASLRIGAIAGAAGDRDTDLLYEFGRNLGMAFQIQDDLLDVYGDVKVFGKRAGGDIVINKRTFPLVKAMEIASPAQLKKLQEQLQAKNADPEEKVSTVIDIFNQLNIKKLTENLAADYIKISSGYLEKVEILPEKKRELFQLTQSLIGRTS